jgi:hypothetical protein
MSVGKVFCVIGDLVASRKIVDRRALQTRLGRGLKELSHDRRDVISPYTITLGDEFQAVYRDPRRIFRDLFAIQHLIHPHRVRFAIGVGSLSTTLNRESAIGMDGPAFLSARDTLTEIKKSGVLYRVAGLPPRTQEWANLSLDLVSHVVRSWRKNRFGITVSLMDGYVPLTIAAQMRLTSAAIYKNISAGALPAVTGMVKLLGTVLRDTDGAGG